MHPSQLQTACTGLQDLCALKQSIGKSQRAHFANISEFVFQFAPLLCMASKVLCVGIWWYSKTKKAFVVQIKRGEMSG